MEGTQEIGTDKKLKVGRDMDRAWKPYAIKRQTKFGPMFQVA